MEKTTQSDIIKTALENVKSMVDANTVTGTPIETASGTIIIPISKIFVGLATGGVDYNPKKENQPKPQNFGGGGGTGLSVSPVGFIIINPKGDVEFINVASKGKPDPVDQIADFVERTPEIIARIKELFSKEPKPTV